MPVAAGGVRGAGFQIALSSDAMDQLASAQLVAAAAGLDATAGNIDGAGADIQAAAALLIP